MKLLKLHLLAYGPFTNVELDLLPLGVHVLYGKNEAGKSTALRAITGLLYGIPKNTPDAHLHRMPDLRVGGTLRGSKGAPLHLVRRKGKENTLVNRHGQPVDDATLATMLGGVSQEQFLTMFGLDHQTLRRGGEALLLGQGNVGESLFGAAMAGGELHQVLRSLRAEADALFSPKAHTKPLNDALRAHGEAHRRARDESMSPESVLAQTRALEELRRERAESEAERQRLGMARAKVERARRALPVLAKRQLAVERRASLGQTVLLAPDASASRLEMQREAREAAVEIARLEADVGELDRRKAELFVPESLVRYAEVPLELANRLGSYLQAARDLPHLTADIDELEGEARAILRSLGRDVPLDEAGAWRIDAATQAAIRKLALDGAALLEAKQQTERALADRVVRHRALVLKRDGLAAAPDVASLKKAVARAEREGAIDEQLARGSAKASRLEQAARAQLSSLGISHLTLEAACGLAVPSPETIERFARQWEAHDREKEQLAGDMLELQNRAANLKRDIEALELSGKIPTERDLEEARARRESTLELVRDALTAARAKPRSAKSPERGTLLGRLEKEIRKADEIADRLRREAERVSRLAALLAARDACFDQKNVATQREKDLGARRRDAHQAWTQLWTKLAIEPEAPSEMRGWLMRHAALVRAADDLRAAEAEAASLRSSIDAHRRSILALVEPVGSPPPGAQSLGSLLDHATQIIDRVEAAARERAALERDIAETEAELEGLRLQRGEHERAQGELEHAWQAAVTRVGLTEKASPEQAAATIDLLSEAFRKIDQAQAERRRVAAIERHARGFIEDVEKLAREHAPDLLERSTERAAAEIIDRYHRGQTAVVERRELDRQLAEAERRLVEQTTRLRAAEDRLGELRARAGVDTLQELERAEMRSEEARDLDRLLADLDAQLNALGGDAASLCAQIEEPDLDAAEARLIALDEELDQLHERANVIVGRIGSAEAGLRDLRDPKARAAEAAAEAEAHLARVREVAERYLKVRVASLVLAREMERYRQENQGPILARASGLFGRLTLGSFRSLMADFDEKDQPVLRGVRSDGREVAVEAMSDGTRDQLYLALRLATLERYAEHHDPMPLVLDDILIHFDDDRARAALEVLGDLSDRTQVLFFTHHARLVDLARKAIPASKLLVRELTEGASVWRAQPGELR